MEAKRIQREIEINESEFHPTGTCVACSSEMRPIDIATQAIHEPSAGMYTCQTCLPVTIEGVLAGSNSSISIAQ